jgi:hypothetical protein
MTDPLDSRLRALPLVDPGPAFTDAVMASLPATRRVTADQGRWLLLSTAAAVILLWLWALPTAQPGPRMAMLREALAGWLPWRYVVLSSARDWGQALPWQAITQTLYATAAGLLIAWGVPALPFAGARRRVR